MMADFAIWINVTAPYASGLGRRTVWRGKVRVEASGTEQALSVNFESVGTAYIHDANHAICVLGAGWEIHLNCPEPMAKYCKACGAMPGHPSNYCRDCCPRPTHADNLAADELKPRFLQASRRPAVGALKTLNSLKKPSNRQRSGRSRRKLESGWQLDEEAALKMLQEAFK